MADFNLHSGGVYSQFGVTDAPVGNTGGWVQVGDTLNIANMGGEVAINAHNTGAVALTDFKITWAFTLGGDHTDMLAGVDFDSPNMLMPFATATLKSIAADGRFKILLNGLEAIAELKFWAKAVGAGTTLTLNGCVRE